MSKPSIPVELGDFLLHLFHTNVIYPQNGWKLKRADLDAEFQRYLSLSLPNKSDIVKIKRHYTINEIEELLRQENFITSSEAEIVIKSEKLLKYRKEKLNDYVEKQKILELATSANDTGSYEIVEKIDESITPTRLTFMGTRDQNRIKFNKTSESCHICQRAYDKSTFRAHVDFHSEKSNFEVLNNYRIDTESVLHLSYQLCQKTRNLRFSMTTNCPDIVVEQIIIVLSDFMYFVHNQKMPIILSSKDRITFDLSYHIFNKNIQLPLVILFHQKGSEDLQRVEQHHYVSWEKQMPSKGKQKLYLSNELRFKAEHFLDYFLPSEELRNILNDKITSAKRIEKLKKFSTSFRHFSENENCLMPENYCGTLQLLLQFEDLCNLKKYINLEQEGVFLRSVKGSYAWSFPHQAEDLLSPLDDVLIVPTSKTECQNTKLRELSAWSMMLRGTKSITAKKPEQYVSGVVQRFHNGVLRFRVEGKNLKSHIKYTLLFRPIRFIMRYQYRALNIANGLDASILKRYFFPTLAANPVEAKLTDIGKLSLQFSAMTFEGETVARLSKDPEQFEAVQRILQGAGHVAPYLIIGPPGTGKTTTIVNAICGLYHEKRTKILVMANSNYACDEICIRLIHMLQCPKPEVKALVRICSHTYEEQADETNSLLRSYSNVQREHFYPNIKVLHEYRIVVCTLNVAGKLALGGFGAGGMYTHVFIDEAPSSTEPETLMGIMCTLSNDTKLILSGDTKQLGTILRSGRALRFGLDVSLMDRLLKRNEYAIGEPGDKYNREIMIRLRHNYRSHPEIMRLYNERYYNNQLIASAPADDVSFASKWHRLPNSEFPIIFHSVFGKMHKGITMSFGNADEIEVLLEYISDLMLFGVNGEKLSETDIGIISPYKEQVNIINAALDCRKLYKVKCGVVERFQGMERKIIIVSFVRTGSIKVGKFEREKKTVGFLNDPRRINTIISRAKSIMILIGDPRCLEQSPCILYLMRKCKENNSFIGDAYDLPLIKCDLKKNDS